ncbi:MAG: gliding motility-associated C-terminal domain-containing protein [Flavobacteriales bacterium]|nr:gliding motility-associated C-terminal domain-containing protein [Flavobacteriales bacterium]
MKIKHLLKYLFVCSLMLLCFEVQATTYYVNNNSDPEDVFCSVAGDDSFNGLSSDKPFLTIGKAILASLSAGDTVLIDAGTYNESVVLNSLNGIEGSPIVFRGADSSLTEINGSPFFAVFSIGASNFITLVDLKVNKRNSGAVLAIGIGQSSNIVLENCIFENSLSTGDGAVVGLAEGADFVEIYKCTIVNGSGNVNSDGIQINKVSSGQASQNITIAGCTIKMASGSLGAGISLYSYVENTEIWGNRIQNGGKGIYIALDQIKVVNTVIYNNYISGSIMGFFNSCGDASCKDGVMKFNSLYVEGDAVVFADTATAWTFTNNIIYSSSTDTTQYLLSLGKGTLGASNYNLFYSEGARVAFFNNGIREDLTDLQETDHVFEGGKGDNNSIFVDPKYVNVKNHDLDLEDTSPAKRAGVLSDVLKDIYGEQRNDPPSIGAFELFLEGEVCESAKAIKNLPFAETGLTTCGLGNDYGIDILCYAAVACGSDYLGGEDYLFKYKPENDICISVSVSGASSGTAVFVKEYCPSDYEGYMAMDSTAGGLSIASVSLLGGYTYYIMVSTDPFETNCTNFNIEVDEVACPVGNSCSNPDTINAIPYSATGLTTEGAGINFYYADLCESYYSLGTDYVFEFIPKSDTCVSITLSNTELLTGLFVTEGCPEVDGYCVAADSSDFGNPAISRVNLSKGITYYIIVSTYTILAYTPFDIEIAGVSCDYCTSTFTDETSEYIQQVTLGDIDNVSGAETGGYNFYTNDTALLFTGGLYSLSVDVNTASSKSERVKVWIDFNHDGFFDDADSPEGELFDLTTKSGSGTINFADNISIPLEALSGLTRMRITVQGSGPALVSCDPTGSDAFGETEDYLVYIKSSCITAPCSNNELEVHIRITTDEFGSETNYVLRDITDGAGSGCGMDPFGTCSDGLSELESNRTYDWNLCHIKGNEIQFVIADQTANGLTAGVGSFFVEVCGDTIIAGDTFGCDLTTSFKLPYSCTKPFISSVDTSYCLSETRANLTGVNAYGTLEWFSDAALTVSIGRGATITPSNTIGATTYYLVDSSYYGCLCVVDSVTVTIETGPTITMTGKDPDCTNDSTGYAIANIKGDLASYLVVWGNTNVTSIVNDQTNDTLRNLPAGNYIIAVDDGSGCLATDSIELFDPLPLYFSFTNVQAPVCEDSLGFLKVSASGGTAPYTFEWDGMVSELDSVFNLSSGTYTATVTDINQCASNGSIFLSESTFKLISTTATNLSCVDEEDGSIAISVFGDVSIYTFIWNDGQGDSVAINLSPGIYTCTVSDGTCTAIITDSIFDPESTFNLIVSTAKQSCGGGANGSITISVFGDPTGYTFIWNDGQTDSIAVGLSAGNYTCTVSDGICTTTVSDSIFDSVSIDAPEVIGGGLFCSGGSTRLSVVSAFTNLTWTDDSGKILATGNNYNPVMELGTTNYFVYDSLETCISNSVEVLVEVLADSVLDVTIAEVNPLCVKASSISLLASPAGGIWSGYGIIDSIEGEFSPDFVEAGVWPVVYTIDAPCVTLDSIYIEVNERPKIDTIIITKTTCGNTCDGSVEVVIGDVVGDAYIRWEFLNPTLNEVAPAFRTGFCPKSFVVRLFDESGCNQKELVVVGSDGALLDTPVLDETNFEYCVYDEIKPLVSDAFPENMIWFGADGSTLAEGTDVYAPEGIEGIAGKFVYYANQIDGICLSDTVKIEISITSDCNIGVYSGISPDGDGVNDYFHIDGISYFTTMKVVIFNRWGDIVKSIDKYNNDDADFRWDGKNTNGDDLPVGTYYYVIDLGDEASPVTGWVQILR